MVVSFIPLSRPKPMHWWNVRRRARRLRFLELVAKTEIRVSLDGMPQLSGTLENAYHDIVKRGSSDHARGLAFADLVVLRSGCSEHEDTDASHQAVISLRLPLDVPL